MVASRRPQREFAPRVSRRTVPGMLPSHGGLLSIIRRMPPSDSSTQGEIPPPAKATAPREPRLAGLDLRSLGAFRIVLGLNFIHNIAWYRLPWIEAYYGDGAVTPRALIQSSGWGCESLLNEFASTGVITAYNWLVLLIAIAFTIGYRTRLMSILLFVTYSQILHANVLTAHAVESLMDAALFWGIFLPLDGAFTKFGPKRETRPLEIRGAAAIGLMLQIVFVYTTSVLTKTGNSWIEGTVIYKATDDRLHGGWLAPLLGEFPLVCTLLSYGSFVVESTIAILVMWPWGNRKARLICGLTIIAFHWSLSFVMTVGPFHTILSAFAVAILPGMFWDKLGVRSEADPRAPQPKVAFQPLLNAVLIFAMIWAGHRMLVNLAKNSWVKGAIDAIPPIRAIADIDSAVGVGMFRQPWFFFAPDAWSEMGCVILVGRTADGTRIDLATSEPLPIEHDKEAKKLVIGEGVWNTMSGSNWTFAMYVRRFYRDLPPEMFERWIRYEYARWREANPDTKLRSISLMLFINKTKTVNGEVVRKPSMRVLHHERLAADGISLRD